MSNDTTTTTLAMKQFAAATAAFAAATAAFAEAQPPKVPAHKYSFGETVSIDGNMDQYRAFIGDAAALANVQSLKLYRMHEITDVSMFRHIRQIGLYYLENVADVSVLGDVGSGVEDLTLNYMPKVTSLTGLGALKVLVLDCLEGVTSIGPVKTVENVYLSDMPNIDSIADLEGNTIRKLVVQYSLPKVSDISPLRNIEVISIRFMPLVSDVSALRGVRDLTLINMRLVVDVSALRGVEHLALSAMPLVSDVSALRGVEHLVLSHMPFVTDVSGLVKVVPTLTVRNCGCDDVNEAQGSFVIVKQSPRNQPGPGP